MDFAYFVSCWSIFELVRGEYGFEAAFQGQCNSSEIPCQHMCRDHSARTFECICREGFHLDHNGYSCLPDVLLDTRPTNKTGNLVLPQLPVADQPRDLPDQASHKQFDTPKLAGSPCAALLCLGGGVCALNRPHGYRCLCPLGRRGKHCQEKVSFITPRFSGDSYAVLPLPTDWELDFAFELQVFAENENGLILFLGENLAASKNYLSVELLDGYVVFRLQISFTSIILQSRYKVPLGDALAIKAGRSKEDFHLKVASEDQIITSVQEVANVQLKATENIYLGGLPDFDQLTSATLLPDAGFLGCILGFNVNGKDVLLAPLPFGSIIQGINLDTCNSGTCQDIQCLNDGQCMIERNGGPKCDCPVTHVGTRCETDLLVEIPQFNTSSYLAFPMTPSAIVHVTNFLVTFRPASLKAGILLHVGWPINNAVYSDSLELRITAGFLELALDLGEGSTISRMPTKLVVDQWYEVALRRTGRYTEILLNYNDKTDTTYAGYFTQLNVADSLLYIGGVDFSQSDEIYPSFQGCIDLNKSEFMGAKLILSRALSAANLAACRST